MPRPSNFGKDTGLQVRMTMTLFLLGLVYAVLIGVIVAARALPLLIIVGGLLAVQFFASDKLALHAMGAREVTPQEAPQLHAMVERLCVQANLPKPRVAVANTPMPNAFAIGRSPKSATVCATTGIMELLSPAELEGVMAHELTHVQNRDVMVMTIASFFAAIASYIVQFGFLFGGGNSDDDDGPGFFVVILVSIGVYILLVRAAAGAVALPRVRCRSRRRDHHRPAERARLGADENLRHDGPHPPARPARLGGAGGLLHLPAAREELADEPVLDAPADGEADRRAEPPRGPAAGRRVGFRRMGLFDILTGKRRLARPAPDRLFAMTTANIKFETELGLRTRGLAGIVFQPLATADFDGIVRDMIEVVQGISGDSDTQVESRDDEYQYRWIVLRDNDFDDLVVGINAVSGALEAGGYGDRILCAVFAFDGADGRPLYWIYNYKRGAFYPFVPAGGAQQRNSEAELRLKAQVGAELPIEAELERWFPLWGIPI